MSVLVTRGGKLLLTAVGGSPKVSDSPLDNDCCCGCVNCCSFEAPVPDLTLTIESEDCPFIDGVTVNMPFENDVDTPAEFECWHGTLVDLHSPTDDCFGSTFMLCCPGGAFELTNAATIASGCIFDQDSFQLVSCTCDPFELVFTGVVIEVAFGCTCCTPGDVVTFRITL